MVARIPLNISASNFYLIYFINDNIFSDLKRNIYMYLMKSTPFENYPGMMLKIKIKVKLSLCLT